jgi:hypothetical protein
MAEVIAAPSGVTGRQPAATFEAAGIFGFVGDSLNSSPER